MLKLFDPQSKVQKDRQIIRETDQRMAKYSRRGLISNFLIYTFSLLIEQTFMQEHKRLAITLTSGLLIVTLLRGYFLFRMDSIYPRAPTAWRNKYFAATLIGASWWGLILAVVTLIMDMKGEAALMWLYTVVFFSTTAHAFAPYKKFLSIYQFIAIVPAAFCTFLIGEFAGVFYGCILLFFFWLLKHHCDLMSQNYWERLEAQYTLARKTESLEEEKRDTRASVRLTKEYLDLLGDKMRMLLRGHQEADEGVPPSPVTVASQRANFDKLYQNVNDFNRILAKDLEVKPRIFNIRHYLQFIIKKHVEDAERKGIELEMALSPALPARLEGDAARIGQIVSTMIKSAIQQSKVGVLFVEVEFMREYEVSGELHVTVARQTADNKKSFFQSGANQPIVMDLDLILAKGLADILGGELDVDELSSMDGKDIRLRCPLSVAEVNARPEYHRLEYKGRPILLMHQNARWLDHKRLELDSMGFEVITANNAKRALQILNEAVTAGKVIESVVFYAASGDDQAVQFCNELLSHNELKYTHQFVICSAIGRRFFSERALQHSPLLHYVDKPCGVFEFEISLSSVFDQYADGFMDLDEKTSKAECRILWVALGKNFDNAKLYENDGMKIFRVGDLKQIAKILEQETFQLAIVENTGNEDFEGINCIRYVEKSETREFLISIIGVGPAQSQESMLEHGVDHFINIESLVSGDTRELRFWAGGHQH